MDDPGNLAGIERAPRTQGDKDRGAGLLAVTQKGGGPRDGQMHAHRGDRAHGADGARQLALQAALVVHLLAELRQADFLLIQQFEADVPAAGQAAGGEAQPGFVDGRPRHENDRAVPRQAIGDILLLQRGDDRGAVAGVQVGKQDAILGLAAPQQQGREQGEHQGATDGRGDFARRGPRGQPCAQGAQARAQGRGGCRWRGGLRVGHAGPGRARAAAWPRGVRCARRGGAGRRGTPPGGGRAGQGQR